MIVVADASPIIALSRVDRLTLLRRLFSEIILPMEVRDEIADGPGGARLLDANPWLECRAVQDASRVDRLAQELDRGEAAAIILATELRADLLLMDERRGRVLAQREGLSVLGVVGVLLRAKQLGALPAIGPVLEQLVEHGRFHLSLEVIHRAREIAGE